MNYFLYLFSKIFGSKIANWIDNDGEVNVALLLILAVIPVWLLIYFSELDQDHHKSLFFGFIFITSCFYAFLKPYFNYLLILNFIFWLIVLIFNFPNFYKTLPLKFSTVLNQVSTLRDENSKNDQENIICENYWTLNNEFQDIRKTKKYKETENKEDKIRIIKKELNFVKREFKKELEKAKNTNCQLTSKREQIILQNLKYMNELNKEIEKSNTR
jgi:hypothetical protein